MSDQMYMLIQNEHDEPIWRNEIEGIFTTLAFAKAFAQKKDNASGIFGNTSQLDWLEDGGDLVVENGNSYWLIMPLECDQEHLDNYTVRR